MNRMINVATRFDNRIASVFALTAQRLSKGRDEGRGECAFGEQIAQQIGNAKRGNKCVKLQTGAEENGEDLVAH